MVLIDACMTTTWMVAAAYFRPAQMHGGCVTKAPGSMSVGLFTLTLTIK
jgi:hypothetical protein